MKFLSFIFLVCTCYSFSQEINKENLTPKIRNYYDFKKTQLESVGSNYKDLLGETSDKHGKWLYYDKGGVQIEERNYYRGKLNGRVLAQYSNGKNKQEGYFKMDIQDSVYREWSETGVLLIEGYYKNGRPFGIWKYNYLSGSPKMVEEYLDTTKYLREFWMPDSTQTIQNGNGEYIVYYNLGTIKEWYNYKDGLKNGPFEEFSIYGHKLISGAFKNGLNDSTWNYYYYTGPIEKIRTYENGVLQGDYSYYFDNGQLNVKGQYTNGHKSGKWYWYTNKGGLDQEGSFNLGKQDGHWKYYYPTGELSYEAEYDNGLKTGTWQYFDKDGGLFKKGTYKNDLKEGLWQTWYENGNLVMEGSYKAGKEEGVWKNFWENGLVKNVSTFKDGKLNGAWFSYYPTGAKKLSGKYKSGNKVGEWITYFENGKMMESVTYKIITKKNTAINYGPLKDFKTQESIMNGHFVSYSQKDYKKTQEGNYKMGEKDGVWYTYWPGGKIPSNTTSYKLGKLDGKSTEMDRRGDVISETEYKDGLKHGSMKLYDKRGKVLKELYFEFGQQVNKASGGSNVQFNPR